MNTLDNIHFHAHNWNNEPVIFHRRQRMKGGMAYNYGNKIVSEQMPPVADGTPDTARNYYKKLEQDYNNLDDTEDINDLTTDRGNETNHIVRLLIKEMQDNTELFSRHQYFKTRDDPTTTLDPNDITRHSDLETKARNNIKKIKKLLNDITQDGFVFKPEQKTLYDRIEQEYHLAKTNPKLFKEINDSPLFKEEDQEAQRRGINRGDVSEETTEKEPYLYGLMGDITDINDVHNTKSLDAYSDEFLDVLIKLYGVTDTRGNPVSASTLKNMKHTDPTRYTQIVSDMVDGVLKWMPVDSVKGNTLYENKSYSNPISKQRKTGSPYEGEQKFQTTKLNGYTSNLYYHKNGRKLGAYYIVNPSNYTFTIDKASIPGKVKNIYLDYNIIGNKVKNSVFDRTNVRQLRKTNIPVFKDIPGGYNYRWVMDNKDGIAFVNPLDPKRKPELKTKRDQYGNMVDDLYIDNSKLDYIPRSYNIQVLKALKKNRKYKKPSSFDKFSIRNDFTEKIFK